MGIIQKNSIKVSLIIYLGFALGYVNSLMLFTKIYSSEQIGALRLIFDSAFIFVPFIQLGGTAIGSKFYPHFSGTEKEQQSFLQFLLLLPFIGIIVLMTTFAIFPVQLGELLGFTEDVMHFVHLIAPLAGLIALSGILTSYLANTFKIVTSNFLTHIFLRLVAFILVIAYYYEYIDFEKTIYLTTVAYFVQFIILAFQAIQSEFFHTRGMFAILQSKHIKEIAWFGFYMMLGMGSTFFIQKMDTIMTSKITKNLSFTGIYTTAFYIGNVLEVPKRVMGQLVVPLITKHFKADNNQEVIKLYSATSINQLIVGAVLFLLIWSNIDFLFEIMPNGEIYKDGKYVILFIGLGRLYDMAWGCNGEILSMSPYYKWNLPLMVLMAVLTILTNRYLIPIYEINGTALATAITIFVINTLRGAFLYWKYQYQPFNLKHFYTLILSFGIYYVVTITPSLNNPFLNIGLISFEIIVLFVPIAFLLKISPEFNQLLLSKIKKD